MIQGLYAAATGMMAVEDRHAVIANNIANASTTGFKRQDTVQEGFYEMYLGAMHSPSLFDVQKGPGGGVHVMETFTDLSAGPLKTTGNPLDIALMGPGYLTVETPNGERFTRNGQLSLNSDGELITEDGYRVLGTGGQGITVQGAHVEFDEEGRVMADGQPVGQLRLVEFEDPHMLTREGHTLYVASDAAMRRSTTAANTRIAPESLEASNIQVPIEMINMLLAVRAYAANQTAITTISDTASRLINEVGMPL